MNREREGLELDRERTRTRDLPRYSARDIDAMRDIGDFRVIRPRDLAAFRYDGDHPAVDRLATSGYVRRYTIHDPRTDPFEVLAVTRRGRQMLHRLEPDRPVYTIYRPQDLRHDADVYPAVVQARERIERDGGHTLRVIQGGELYAERARMVAEGKRSGDPVTIRRQREIAEALDLTVVNGRVLVPDARLEYIDHEGRKRYEDIEVTTPSYGTREKSAKSQAGFHLVTGVSFTHGRAAYRDGR